MSEKLKDYQLALRVAGWLFHNGCAAVTVVVRDDRVDVNYTLRLDVKPQPAIVVRDGKVIIPSGSQVAVVMAFLGDLS